MRNSGDSYVGGGDMFQLRVYKVNPKKRVDFHDRFKNHAMRIMKTYDFNIVAMWEVLTESEMEFIYILDWADVEVMERQWQAFLRDQEWLDVKKKMDGSIGEPVLQVTSRVLSPVEYSPVSTIQVP